MDNKGYGYMGSRIPFILNTERKPGEKKVKDINENGEYATFDCIAVDVDVAGLQPSGELSITENNTYDVTSYASAVVNVPNPSTGTKDITANGNNIDVKDYAAVNVNVPQPSGTKEIISNGTVNVKNYEYADVNVPAAIFTPVSKGTNHDITVSISQYASGIFEYSEEPSGYEYWVQGEEDWDPGLPAIHPIQLGRMNAVTDETEYLSLSEVTYHSGNHPEIVLLGTGTENMGCGVLESDGSPATTRFTILMDSSTVSYEHARELIDSYFDNGLDIIDMNGTLIDHYDAYNIEPDIRSAS